MLDMGLNDRNTCILGRMGHNNIKLKYAGLMTKGVLGLTLKACIN